MTVEGAVAGQNRLPPRSNCLMKSTVTINNGNVRRRTSGTRLPATDSKGPFTLRARARVGERGDVAHVGAR